jgi:hypothetical protein
MPDENCTSSAKLFTFAERRVWRKRLRQLTILLRST